MPSDPDQNPSVPHDHEASTQPFFGFALPTSNTTYTPNQFFDVCLPHCSRGCVRLVAYLIRRTLGWCDREGKPQEEQIAVSYSELSAKANINRDMIRSAIDEAIEGHFITCVRPSRRQIRGQASQSALYELKWDERSEYVKDPRQFRGFFAGEGNRTYIPNQFFDHVICHEPLAVIRVVGSVIRFSIGFQNKWGHRRSRASLSYQHLQNYSHIRDRKTVSAAIRRGLAANYIERVEAGYFDPDAGKLSKAAVYAVKWLQARTDGEHGRKTPPGEDTPKTRSETPTDNGRKTPPGERSENPTDTEIKQTNKTLKQQEPLAAAALERLKEEGFDRTAAEAIVSRHAAEKVHRQIDWIDRRAVKTNRLGMLRRAIEQDWLEPATSQQLCRHNSRVESGAGFTDAVDKARRRLIGKPTHPRP